MAAFDPATIQLQRELLARTNAQHRRDLTHLNKFQPSSKAKKAQALRERINEAVRVTRDLEGLIRFMEGLNREQLAELNEPYDVADLGPEYSDGYPLPGELEERAR